MVQCCMIDSVAHQHTDKATLQLLRSIKPNFQLSWYKKYPWLSVHLTNKRVICLYCPYATKHNWISLARADILPLENTDR